tara:strand:- start:176 stop:541 length:366 start_codon:yes stop_codon:yes gene_type:complete
MEKWTNRSDKDKLITRMAICAVALLCIFFLFSCQANNHTVSTVKMPDNNKVTETTTDSTDVINDDKADEPADSTGLEESIPVTEEIPTEVVPEVIEEVVEPVNESDTDTLSVPNDTTNTIK